MLGSIGERAGYRSLALATFVALALAGSFPADRAQAGIAGSTAQINIDEQGLALQGYDPVAYFEGGKPTHGVESISTSYGGARYFFTSEAHRAAFLVNPAKYVPQFGGFCAVGASYGKKVDTDPETGKVVDGKLYLNFNPSVKEIFEKDVSGTIDRAEHNWPSVKDKPL